MNIANSKLKILAEKLDVPLYIVGGYIRNYLIAKDISSDVDLASEISVENLLPFLSQVGYKIFSVYNHTGTIVFGDEKDKYEFTTFRKEIYGNDGKHTPEKTEFTNDIVEDAKRRDFKCNAVYYDILNDKIVDPLGGLEDIKNKVLDTVIEPDKVFCNDGLRLMRLARLSAELNFSPKKCVLDSAKKYAKNIIDISSERIFSELNKILYSDKKYFFSDKNGHYDGLKILSETFVLDYIIPELTLGRNMAQREDFHKYDVLEHSLRSVLYSKPDVRLASLLHDVGKPFCKINYGKYSQHDKAGKEIAVKILERLKVDTKTILNVSFLVENHMIDLKTEMEIEKVKLFIIQNKKYISDLLEVKQADYRASKDFEDTCPTVIKWKKIISDMEKLHTPFSLTELNIAASELIKLGYKGKKIGEELSLLLNYCINEPENNKNDILLSKAKLDILK